MSTPSGLLADEMGLGKTLSMLTAIISTLDEAQRFEFAPPQPIVNDRLSRPTKATLVVVPSARRFEVTQVFHD